jgi:hypothetical protein
MPSPNGLTASIGGRLESSWMTSPSPLRVDNPIAGKSGDRVGRRRTRKFAFVTPPNFAPDGPA